MIKAFKQLVYLPLIMNVLLVINTLYFGLGQYFWQEQVIQWKYTYYDHYAWLPVTMVIISLLFLFTKAQMWLKIATILALMILFILIILFPDWYQYA